MMGFGPKAEYKQGVTNPRQESVEVATNTFLPHGVIIRVVLAQDVLWVGGVVWDATAHTVREF